MARKRKEKKSKVIKLVRLSNSFVEAHYKFSAWESRIFLEMLTQINYEDEDFKTYRIYFTDAIKKYGLENSNSSYERLRAWAAALRNKTVVFTKVKDGELFETSVNIIAWIDRPLEEERREDAKFIDLSFHPDIKPHLLSLKDSYTACDPRNLKMVSSYYWRIYQILKQYERIWERTIKFVKLKKMIGAIEAIESGGKIEYIDYIPKYSAFRTKVLLKAQEKLKEYTDITFTFEPIKRGRSYHAIRFIISSNTPEWEKDLPPTLFPNKDENAVLLHEPISQRVSLDQVTQRVASYGYETISAAVAYTLHQIRQWTNIHNVPGYIVSLLKQPATLSIPTNSGESDDLIVKSGDLIVLEKQYKDVEVQLREEQLRIIHTHLLENSDIKQAAIASMVARPIVRYDETISYEENFSTNGIFRSSLLLWVRNNHPKLVEAVDLSALKRIQSKIAKVKAGSSATL